MNKKIKSVKYLTFIIVGILLVGCSGDVQPSTRNANEILNIFKDHDFEIVEGVGYNSIANEGTFNLQELDGHDYQYLEFFAINDDGMRTYYMFFAHDEGLTYEYVWNKEGSYLAYSSIIDEGDEDFNCYVQIDGNLKPDRDATIDIKVCKTTEEKRDTKAFMKVKDEIFNTLDLNEAEIEKVIKYIEEE